MWKTKNIPLQLRALCAWYIQNIMLDFYFEEMKYLQHFLYKNKFDWSFDPSPDISEVFSICTLWSRSNNLIWKSTFLIMFVWSGVWPLGLSFFSLLLRKLYFILISLTEALTSPPICLKFSLHTVIQRQESYLEIQPLFFNMIVWPRVWPLWLSFTYANLQHFL